MQPDVQQEWTAAQRAYPQKLAEAESERIAQRRKAAGVEPAAPRVGFALSGGGIRSATFCLGVFQALARHKLIRKIDYLSTVSGGGYFGAFLGRLFARNYSTASSVEHMLTPGSDPLVLDEPLPGGGTRTTRVDPLRWLRDNSRYLAPRGTGDLMAALATQLRNWTALQVILVIFLLMVFLGLQVLRVSAENLLPGQAGLFELPVHDGAVSFWWSPLWYLLAPLALLVLVPLGWAYWLVGRKRDELGEIHPLWGLGVALLLSLLGLKAMSRGWVQELPALRVFFQALAATGVVTYLAYLRANARGTLATILELGRINAQKYFGPAGRPTLLVADRRWLSRATLVGAVLLLALGWQLGSIGVAPAARVGALAAGVVLFLVYIGGWLRTRRVYNAALAACEAREPGSSSLIHRFREEDTRSTITQWLASSLGAAFLLAGAAFVDSAGQTVYALWMAGEGALAAAAGAVIAALAPLLMHSDRLAAWFRPEGGAPARVRTQVLAFLVAAVALAAILVAVDTLAHAFAWGFQAPLADGVRASRPDYAWGLTRAALLVAVLFSLLFGRAWPFLNRSSHHPLYAARLTRTFLGGSNRDRFDKHLATVSKPIPGDDISDGDYWHAGITAKGAPLHIVNVTVNETAIAEDRTVNRDRKGVTLAAGPCGVSAGVRHHALFVQAAPEPDWMLKTLDTVRNQFKRRVWKPVQQQLSGAAPRNVIGALNQLGRGMHQRVWRPIREALAVDDQGRREVELLLPPGSASNMFGRADGVKRIESLTLGQWTAISGAAFSTGLGARTNLALSLLLGLANVRLGYWWNSGSDAHARSVQRSPARRLGRALRRLLPVQRYLLDELTATFHGPDDPLWYLSDGGHFENMGAYELIRRRLPMIVIVDAEADSDYAYEGLANLVRKARLDFRAEIAFMDEVEVKRAVPAALRDQFGSLDELRPDPKDGFSRARAALATVRYADSDERSLILYLKPTLRAADPADVREYKAANPQFPQQSTLDQFFDEAQWESYRRLGETIAADVFAAVEGQDARFAPAKLDPRDVFKDPRSPRG